MTSCESDSDLAAWARHLADAGCVEEALSLRRVDSPAAEIDRVLLALGGGRAEAVAPVLERLRADPGEADDQLMDWLGSVAAAMNGVGTALPDVVAGAGAFPPSPAVDRLVVRAAAGLGRLDVVGSAGSSLPAVFALDTDLLSLVAAGRTAVGETGDGLTLIRHCESLGDDEAGARAVDVLTATGHHDAAVQLAVLGSHLAHGPGRRRWRALAKRVAPRRDARDWLELGVMIALVVTLVGLFSLPGGLLAAGLGWLYHRLVRRAGRDPFTSELVRAHRTGTTDHTQIPGVDALMATAGVVLGLMAGASLVGRFERSTALAAVCSTAPVLILPAVLVGTRRWAAGRLAARRGEGAPRNADAACRCYGAVGFRGPRRRPLVAAHLATVDLVQDGASPMRLLRRPSTGVHFLDVPAREVTVAVPPRSAEQPVDEASIGQYV